MIVFFFSTLFLMTKMLRFFPYGGAYRKNTFYFNWSQSETNKRRPL